jgi:DNA-binding MltR family transcriptional regulator
MLRMGLFDKAPTDEVLAEASAAVAEAKRLAEADAMLDEMFGANERAGAIVAVAFLEDVLSDAISTRFRPLTEGARKLVFETGGAPLSSLSAKIHIAYALGLISSAAREDLLKLKAVRNLFAHEREVRSFLHKKVQEHCAVLNYEPEQPGDGSALYRFQSTAAFLLTRLIKVHTERSGTNALALALGEPTPAIRYPKKRRPPKPKPRPGKGPPPQSSTA